MLWQSNWTRLFHSDMKKNKKMGVLIRRPFVNG
jgi:hypothetical protein